MNLTIRPLTPDLFPALEDLFGDQGPASRCWCMYWRIGAEYLKQPREKNKTGFALLIAEVTDGSKTIRAKLRTPEAYYLTGLTSVEIMKRILANDLKPGFQTPSKVYGADFIMQFAGVQREDL